LALFGASRFGFTLGGDTPKLTTAQMDAEIAGTIRQALKGELGRNTQLSGAFDMAYARGIGAGFVGPGARLMSGGKGLESENGLRVFRFPTAKSYEKNPHVLVGNLEARAARDLPYYVNIHVYVWMP
jgi:hypothetical protein